MNLLLYAEITTICCIILGLILFECRKDINKQMENIVFQQCLWATLAILITDLLWTIVEGRPGRIQFYINYIINCTYMILSGIISYNWLLFVICKINKGKILSKRPAIFLSFPIIILAVMTLLSPLTKWIFYIDSQNTYHRGPFHFIQIIISYGYLFITIIYIIYKISITSSKLERADMRFLICFGILPLLSVFGGLFLYGIPLYWAASTLSLLMMYLRFQNYKISTDSLTGLNNRRQFDRYLQNTITKENIEEQKWFLFMMDINSFKKINDNYGHLAGDNALTVVASILRKVCSSYSVFLSRYGGDEFTIVCSFDNAATAIDFKKSIEETFTAFNDTSVLPYQLTMSIGIAQADFESVENIANLVAAADKALYNEKHMFYTIKS